MSSRLVSTAEPEYTQGQSLLRLGDYEIVSLLATGGMAQVYLGRHGNIAGLQTLVVIKRVLPHLARDEQFLEMFVDEARIAASLDHPNIARIVEVGRAGDEFFLAMELVQGETLGMLSNQLARQERAFPPELACYIVAQVAHGLGYAHALCDADGNPLDIVHRDVSPQNVMLSFQGAVKIIDFGVARALNRLTHTRQGRAKGKVGYMAPEQARGEVVDGRADIFALGIMLWELMTGRRLFRREDPLASTRAVMHEKHEPLSSIVPVDPALDAIVDRALAKDPEQRFATATELANALEAFIVRTHGAAISAATLSRFLNESVPELVQKWRDLVPSPLQTAGQLVIPPRLTQEGEAFSEGGPTDVQPAPDNWVSASGASPRATVDDDVSGTPQPVSATLLTPKKTMPRTVAMVAAGLILLAGGLGAGWLLREPAAEHPRTAEVPPAGRPARPATIARPAPVAAERVPEPPAAPPPAKQADGPRAPSLATARPATTQKSVRPGKKSTRAQSQRPKPQKKKAPFKPNPF